MDDPDATAQPVQETGDDGLPIKQGAEETIPEEILADMTNVWSVFSTEYQDKVPTTELRVILRALDIDLEPNELARVEKQIDPDGEGIIKFANLKLVMEEKLKDVDTVDDLIAQFSKLDKNNDGEIPVPEFKQYMLNMGSKMTAEEIDEMIKEAGGDTTGTIDIQSFCERLCPVIPPEKKKWTSFAHDNGACGQTPHSTVLSLTV